MIWRGCRKTPGVYPRMHLVSASCRSAAGGTGARELALGLGSRLATERRRGKQGWCGRGTSASRSEADEMATAGGAAGNPHSSTLNWLEMLLMVSPPSTM